MNGAETAMVYYVNPCPEIPLLEIAHELHDGTLCSKAKRMVKAAHKTPRWRDAVSDGSPKLVLSHHCCLDLLVVEA